MSKFQTSGNSVEDVLCTDVLHFLQIAFSKFYGSAKIALIATFDGKQLKYDPDHVFEDSMTTPDLVSELPQTLHASKGLIRIENSGTSEPTKLVWFLKPTQYESFELADLWLTQVSNVFRHFYHMGGIARVSSGLAINGLQFWAIDVVSKHIQDRNTSISQNFPIRGSLDAIARVSRTIEEGLSPTGSIVFVDSLEPNSIQFKTPVPLNDSKHVGKLLALTKTSSQLISDGNNLIGVLPKQSTNYLIKATFS